MVTNHVRPSATAEANSVALLTGGLARAAAFDPTGTLSRAFRNSNHLHGASTAATMRNMHWRHWLADWHRPL